MQDDYDEELFNQIYKDCNQLMNRLASTINPAYYGVTPDIIRSWFDDKFIYVFNKYYGEMSDKALKSHIIKSLQQYKCRILRGAYTFQAEGNIDMIRLDDEENDRFTKDVIDEDDNEVNQELLQKVKDYMKKILSDDAYLLFNLQLNPPPMVLAGDNPLSNEKWVKFLDLPVTDYTISYIDKLKESIDSGIKKCRVKFNKEYHHCSR